MTSHFDRYTNMKPSVSEYNKQFSSITKGSLLKDAKQAIAWGSPSNESYGMTHSELINIIHRLVKYIEAQ